MKMPVLVFTSLMELFADSDELNLHSNNNIEFKSFIYCEYRLEVYCNAKQYPWFGALTTISAMQAAYRWCNLHNTPLTCVQW